MTPRYTGGWGKGGGGSGRHFEEFGQLKSFDRVGVDRVLVHVVFVPVGHRIVSKVWVDNGRTAKR